MSSALLIVIFLQLGFLCDSAEEEMSILFENSQFLLTYNLATHIEFEECTLAQRSRARYARMLSFYKLGEFTEAQRLIRGSWPLASDQKRAEVFFQTFMVEKPEYNDEFWAVRKSVWDNRSQPENLAQFLKHPSLSLNDRELITKDLNALQRAKSYSPVGYAALSLIPGLGQAALGKWSSAAISLTLNAMFGFASYEFYRHKLYAPSAVSGTLFSITYVGGMVQAGRLASESNRKARKPYEDSLEQNLFGQLLKP